MASQLCVGHTAFQNDCVTYHRNSSHFEEVFQTLLGPFLAMVGRCCCTVWYQHAQPSGASGFASMPVFVCAAQKAQTSCGLHGGELCVCS